MPTHAQRHVQAITCKHIMHSCLHTCMCTLQWHACMHTQAQMRTCAHAIISVQTTYMQVCTHTPMHRNACAQTHTCICIIGVYSHAHMHVHIHRNECTCTCMHVHACARALTHHDTHNCAFTTTAYGPPQICCGRTSAIWIKPSVTLTGNEWGFRTKRNASLLT